MPPASSPVAMNRRTVLNSQNPSTSSSFPLSPDPNLMRTPSRSSSIGRRKSLRFGSQIGSPDSKEERQRVDGVMDVYQAVVKLCNENKVTTKNSWALNLIENIDTVLGAAKGSFHKASCALSAAVEIYGQRVDGTHADTFKILETVTSGSTRGDADGEAAREKRKKSGNDNNHATASLEMNLANITQNDVERDFDVDPNMRKMMNAHDESGSKGMLLNHLGVHYGCSVVFDTSNVPAFEKHEEEEKTEEKPESIPYTYRLPDTRNAYLCPTMGELRREASLAGADKSSNDSQSATNSSSQQDSQEQTTQNAPLLANETEEPEYWDDFDNDAYEEDDEDDEDEDSGGRRAVAASAAVQSIEIGNVSDGILASTAGSAPEAVETGLLKGDGAAFSATSYFDPKLFASSRSNKTKGWMGPSHWKFVVPVLISSSSATSKLNMKKDKKSDKQEFVIDFFTAPIVDPKLAFVLPLRPSMTQVSKTSTKNSSNHVLPIDVHFHTMDMRRLFGKPEILLTRDAENRLSLWSSTSKSSSSLNQRVLSMDTHVDNMNQGMDGNEDADEDGFYDCDDDFDDDDETSRRSIGAYSNLVAPSHHVEKIHMAFATRAKKVDVKKLKTDLWTCIEENKKNTDLTECVHQMQPAQKNESITVPFYFICVLHLANEMGLELSGSSDLDDVIVRSGSK